MATLRPRGQALILATALALSGAALADHDRYRTPDADLEDIDATAVYLGNVLAVDVKFELEVDDWDGRALLLVLRPLEDGYELSDPCGEPLEYVYDATPDYRDDDDFELERRIHFDLTLAAGIDPYDLRLLGLIVDPAAGLVLDDKTTRISVHRPRVYRSRCDIVATPRVPIALGGIHHTSVAHHRRIVHRRQVVHRRRVIHTTRPTIAIHRSPTPRRVPARIGSGILRYKGRQIELRRHQSVQKRRVAHRRNVTIRRHR